MIQRGPTLSSAAAPRIRCCSEQVMVIAQASAAGVKPLLRNQLLDGRSWVQPTYGGKLFLKNSTGDVVCVKLN